MEPESLEKCLVRQMKFKQKLWPEYKSIGNWRFMNVRTGVVRDLSAANLDEMALVEERNLFVCNFNTPESVGVSVDY